MSAIAAAMLVPSMDFSGAVITRAVPSMWNGRGEMQPRQATRR
jgi:hypothetical protein